MDNHPTALLSRRQALKFGAGVAAAAATGGTLDVLAFDGGVAPTDERDEVSVEGVGAVVAVKLGSVLARTADGHTVSASLVGFPAAATPRIGDLVAISTPTAKPLCAADRAQSAMAGTASSGAPVAVPLCHWTRGTLILEGNVLMIGALHLEPSSDVMRAVQQRATVAVCTMDTTRSDHRVLSVRPVTS